MIPCLPLSAMSILMSDVARGIIVAPLLDLTLGCLLGTFVWLWFDQTLAWRLGTLVSLWVDRTLGCLLGGSLELDMILSAAVGVALGLDCLDAESPIKWTYLPYGMLLGNYITARVFKCTKVFLMPNQVATQRLKVQPHLFMNDAKSLITEACTRRKNYPTPPFHTKIHFESRKSSI